MISAWNSLLIMECTTSPEQKVSRLMLWNYWTYHDDRTVPFKVGPFCLGTLILGLFHCWKHLDWMANTWWGLADWGHAGICPNTFRKLPSQCDVMYQRNELSLDILLSVLIFEAEVDVLNGTGFHSYNIPFTSPNKCHLWFIFNLHVYQAYSHLRLSHCVCNSCGRSHPGMNFLSHQFIFP
jgi:hypothetical protein